MNYLFFILFLIPFSSVYADTFNDVTITMDDARLEIDTPITANDLLIEADGFSTRFASDDNYRKYTFDRTASAVIYNVDWSNHTATSIGFDVASTVTDARLLVTGSQPGTVDIGATSLTEPSGDWSFVSSLSTILAQAETSLELFFTGETTTTGGSTGSTTNPATKLEIIAGANEQASEIPTYVFPEIISYPIELVKTYPALAFLITVVLALIGGLYMAIKPDKKKIKNKPGPRVPKNQKKRRRNDVPK